MAGDIRTSKLVFAALFAPQVNPYPPPGMVQAQLARTGAATAAAMAGVKTTLVRAGFETSGLAGERVALASHRVVLSDSDLGIARRIEARFRDAGLDPPDAADVLRDEGREKAGRILDLLQEDGRLVRIRDGRWFHAEAIAELIRKLRRFAQTSRRIDVAAFKDLAGVTRKNAIPLLEHLDAERVTRRVGNEREILGA